MTELQRTEDWHVARVGKLTASRFSDAIAKTKTGWGASRANYMAELISERLTGVPYPQYRSTAMQWGEEVEAAARAAYAFYRDVDVVEVGFIDHPTIAMAGASPDGLVGDDGLVEFKCPNTATHIETLLGAAIPNTYLVQCGWQMACTGRKWCDWVSFDPRLPERMQLFVDRIWVDDNAIRDMEKLAQEFLEELAAKEEKLRVRLVAVAA